MTIPRFQELSDYWMRHPPAHITNRPIAEVLGIKFGEKPRTSMRDQDGYEEPALEGTNDLTRISQHPAWRDGFSVQKMRVVKIENGKVVI